MELEPDEHGLAQLSTRIHDSKSGVWWVTVIAIGVLIGNIFSFGAYQLYVRWELKQFTAAVDSMLEKQREITQAELARISKENTATRKERKKQARINTQFRKTCEFWRQQVKIENTSQNRAYRDVACSKASGLRR